MNQDPSRTVQPLASPLNSESNPPETAAVTVNALLVARRANPLFENSRSSYAVPAANVVTATTVTVNALLVARRVNRLFENSRNSYVVPAAAPAGIGIPHDPDATAAPTACVQLPA